MFATVFLILWASFFSPAVSFVTTPSLSYQKISSTLSMSSTSTKPEIEVIHNPDQDFLEKKGVCKYS